MRNRLTLALTFVCSTAALAEEPFVSLSFEDACKKAKAEKKIVLIDFYTTWCGPCKMLDRTTWKDPKVRTWLAKHTVALKIDAERNRKLSSKYKVNSFPTILFLKDNGAELDRLVGYRPPDAFLEDARGAISGKDSVTRAKEKLEAGGKNDPMQRLQFGMTLAQSGKKKEALDEYLWCFDHGLEASPAFRGVRLSFLLMYIHQLGSNYKPAIDALHERRDAAEHALLGGKSDKTKKSPEYPRSRFEAATEVAAINRELHDGERIVRVYENLTRRGEKDQLLLGVLLDEVLDELIEAKQYAGITAALSDPLAAVEQKIGAYKSMKEYEKSNPREGVPSSAAHFKKQALDQGGKIYEALVGALNLENARKVAQRLLKFDKRAATYESLMEHALRADGDEEADWLLQRARKKLKKEDLEDIEELAKSIKDKPKKGQDDE